MKKNISLNMFSLLPIMFIFGCQSEVEATSDQTLDQRSDLTSASYLIGYQQMRMMLDQTGDAINLDAFALGTADAISGRESQVAADREEIVLNALSAAISANKSALGNQYRADNAARPEVTTLASGLQYEVIKTGGGPKPGPTDTVSTRRISCERSDCWVDRGAAVDGCWLQMAFSDSA